MRFLRQKATFFDLFDQHTSNLVEISKELLEMWKAFDHLPERQARIKDLEHRCDDITHQLATEMHASFVTPLDKEDIAAMATGLDDIADYVDAVGDRIVLYEIRETSADAIELTGLLVECVEVLRGAVTRLRSTREKAAIIAACREMHGLENRSDTCYRRALGALFNTPGADPIAVMKWKEIFDRLEMAVDKCEDVANILESIQLKYS